MTFHELKHLISGYSRTSYIFSFNTTVLKRCVHLTSYPTEIHFPSYWFAGHRSKYFVTVLKFYCGWMLYPARLESIPFNCLKAKGLTTQKYICKTELMTSKKTTAPSLFTTLIHLHIQNLFFFLNSSVMQQFYFSPLQRYSSVRRNFSEYGKWDYAVKFLIQLNLNTCLNYICEYKYVHKVWFEGNELIYKSQKNQSQIVMPRIYVLHS